MHPSPVSHHTRNRGKITSVQAQLNHVSKVATRNLKVLTLSQQSTSTPAPPSANKYTNLPPGVSCLDVYLAEQRQAHHQSLTQTSNPIITHTPKDQVFKAARKPNVPLTQTAVNSPSPTLKEHQTIELYLNMGETTCIVSPLPQTLLPIVHDDPFQSLASAVCCEAPPTVYTNAECLSTPPSISSASTICVDNLYPPVTAASIEATAVPVPVPVPASFYAPVSIYSENECVCASLAISVAESVLDELVLSPPLFPRPIESPVTQFIEFIPNIANIFADQNTLSPLQESDVIPAVQINHSASCESPVMPPQSVNIDDGSPVANMPPLSSASSDAPLVLGVETPHNVIEGENIRLSFKLPRPAGIQCPLCSSVLKCNDAHSERSLRTHLRHIHHLQPELHYSCRFCLFQPDPAVIRQAAVVKTHITENHSHCKVVRDLANFLYICQHCEAQFHTARARQAHVTRSHNMVAAGRATAIVREVRLPPLPAMPTTATIVQNASRPIHTQRDWHRALLNTESESPMLVRLRDLFQNFEESQAWDDVETAVEELTSTIQGLYCKSHKAGGKRPTRQRDCKQNARFLQQRYPRAKKVTVESILCKRKFCTIDGKVIEAAFSSSMSNEVPPDLHFTVNYMPENCISRSQNEDITRPFSHLEVANCIASLHDSAPGEDGVSYSHLKKFDPSALIFTHLFNVCLAARRVPLKWKSAVVTLLHKKGDHNELDNWRPISLSSTMYKVYTRLLSNRLSNVLPLLLSPEQKGFTKNEGCTEHTFLIDTAIHSARQDRRSLAMAFLDLSNAFGSVPHTLILQNLRRAGLSDQFVQLVEDLYSDTTCKVRTENGCTGDISIGKGVKQGDPLSALLFNIAIEPLLRMVKAKHESNAFSLHGRKLNVLAYADDLVIVTDSSASLRHALHDVNLILQDMSLAANPQKCGTMTLERGKLASKQYKLGMHDLPALKVGDHYKYLGTPTGIHCDTTPTQTLSNAIRDMYVLRDCLLAPQQKLDAIKVFILPRLTYILRHTDVPRAPLVEFQKALVDTARQIMKLPTISSVHHIFGTTRQGGLGITGTLEEQDMQILSHAFRLLSSPNEDTKNLAWNTLLHDVKSRLKRQPTDFELSSFFEGGNDTLFSQTSAPLRSLWPRLRQAARRLKPVINLSFIFSISKRTVALRFIHPECKDTPTVLLTDEARNAVCRSLRAALHHSHDVYLTQKLKLQGRVMPQVAKDSVSTAFVRDGKYISHHSSTWIHAARLNVLPLNANPRMRPYNSRMPSSVMCRRCGRDPETLAHVMCHCPTQLCRNITARHDNIHHKVATLLATRFPDIRNNMQVPGSCSRLRPDIVAFDHEQGLAVVLDITCPMENRTDAFAAARTHKRSKYCNDAVLLAQQGYKVICDALVVGALGSWDPFNDRILKAIGVPKTRIYTLKRQIVAQTIDISRTLYWEHIFGNRYTNYGKYMNERTRTSEEPSVSQNSLHCMPVCTSAFPVISSPPMSLSGTQLVSDFFQQLQSCSDRRKTWPIDLDSDEEDHGESPQVSASHGSLDLGSESNCHR